MLAVQRRNRACTTRKAMISPIIPTSSLGVTSSEVTERLKRLGLVLDVVRVRGALVELRTLRAVFPGGGGGGF